LLLFVLGSIVIRINFNIGISATVAKAAISVRVGFFARGGTPRGKITTSAEITASTQWQTQLFVTDIVQVLINR